MEPGAILSLEESYLTKSFLRRTSESLTKISMWYRMDDITLGILAQHCLHLESLDIRKSKNVTHFGIVQLLNDEYSHCISSLREINLTECSNVPSFSFVMIIGQVCHQLLPAVKTDHKVALSSRLICFCTFLVILVHFRFILDSLWSIFGTFMSFGQFSVHFWSIMVYFWSIFFHVWSIFGPF